MIEFFCKNNPHPGLSNRAESRQEEMEENRTTVQANEADDKMQSRETDSITSVEPSLAASSGSNGENLPTTAMPILAIKVENRYRKKLGNLNQLITSIREVGLLHPIVVTSDHRLVAGQRRLEAYRMLGLDEIPVRVVDLENLVKAEYYENVARMDFSPLEAQAISEALEPIEREKAEQRKKGSGRRAKKSSAEGQQAVNDGGKLPPEDRGKTRDKVAAATGYSATSLRKVREIRNAATENPDKYGHLLDELEEKGRIEPVYKKLKQIREGRTPSKEEPHRRVSGAKLTKMETVQPCKESSQKSLENHNPAPSAKDESKQMPAAKPGFSSVPSPTECELIVVNTPWEKGNSNSFSPMSVDEIALLPVRDMASENCILWLRSPSSHLAHAYAVLEAWGFHQVDVLTWIKPEADPGEWLLNQTEHFILGTRGRPSIDEQHRFSSALNTSKKTGTENPSGFHKLVEEFCPATRRVELFARTARPGWCSWPTEDQSASKAELPEKLAESAEVLSLSEAQPIDCNTQMNVENRDTLGKEVAGEAEPEPEAGLNGSSPDEVWIEAEAHDTVQPLLPDAEVNCVTAETEGSDRESTETGEGRYLPAHQSSSLEETAEEPEQFTLVLSHSNGRLEQITLCGEEIPDFEDWPAYGDDLWDRNEKSKDGPLVSVRMEDGRGHQHFHTIEYGI